jgi:hypothetical protein
MASPGALVRGMAEVMGMSHVYVAAYDRELAKHGLRSKHGRGSSAASMTSEDAVNLLLAIMSGAQAKDAAEAVGRYSGLIGKVQKTYLSEGTSVRTFYDYRGTIDSGSLNLSTIDDLPVGHTFFDFLDAIVFSAHSGKLEKAVGDRVAEKINDFPSALGSWGLNIRVSGPKPRAEISLGSDGSASGCIYSHSEEGPSFGDLQREMSISESTIIGIGRILRE